MLLIQDYIFFVYLKDRLFVKYINEFTKSKLKEYFHLYDKNVRNYPNQIIDDDSWLKLGKYLLEPISKFIEKSDHIIFVPHNTLHYIPIHTLELNGEY